MGAAARLKCAVYGYRAGSCVLATSTGLTVIQYEHWLAEIPEVDGGSVVELARMVARLGPLSGRHESPARWRKAPAALQRATNRGPRVWRVSIKFLLRA